MSNYSPLVLICIDGFDPVYFDAIETPNMDRMIENGFYTVGKSMWPSVTNVNNVSIITGQYPSVHGICSNYRYIQETKEEVYMESGEYILAPTIFSMCKSKNITTVLSTSKDKLRRLLGNDATHVSSAEKPDKWVVDILGDPPSIYSLECNGWTINAAELAMEKYKPEFVYITTTDWAHHKFPPESIEAKTHINIIDTAVGNIMNKFPEATIMLSADHGMSRKTNLIDLGKILKQNGIDNLAVPIIKDEHVVHHSNLGGAYFIYLDDSVVSKSIDILNALEGVDLAMTSEEAVTKYNLRLERIGQVIVTADKDTVFGDTNLVEMPGDLRSHGSEHEQNIPIIGYNLKNTNYTFTENRHMGTYVIEQLGLLNK